MELELGLKITHTRDDITSLSNLQLTKNYAAPLFFSTETDSIFFLIAHLNGFKRDNIKISINKDGNQVTITGQRAVQEMVLSGYIMQRKDVELREFRKVFQIPRGIILDRIKAKFNDEESILTIIMPKLEKGMRGLQIEEVETDEIAEAVNKELERQDKEPDREQTKDDVVRYEEEKKPDEDDEDKEMEEQESIDVERQKDLEKGSKLCRPFVVAGSAILVSLVVLVVSFMRSKKKHK